MFILKNKFVHFTVKNIGFVETEIATLSSKQCVQSFGVQVKNLKYLKLSGR